MNKLLLEYLDNKDYYPQTLSQLSDKMPYKRI